MTSDSSPLPAAAASHTANHVDRRALAPLALAALGVLYGDGVITPAISVLSAMEGLSVATPRFEPFVVPLTVMILVGLFVVQKRGTAGVGAVFGPATLVWFFAIGMAGLHWIVANPSVLAAVAPWHGLHFFYENGLRGFLLLGAVVLC